MDAIPQQAPPTEQGDFVPWKAPAAWPTAIGVISIVLGSLGVLVYAWGAVAPFVVGSFRSFSAPGMPNMTATFQAQRDMAPYTIGAAVLCIIASILLFTSGIGLASRRPWGATLSRVWAFVKIIVSVLVVIANFMLHQATFAAMSRQTPAPPGGVMTGFALGGALFSVALYWAYPIFMLIWLSRPKVREEIAGWAA